METIKWLSIADRHTKMYLDKKLEPLGLNSSQHMPGAGNQSGKDVFLFLPSPQQYYPSHCRPGKAGFFNSGNQSGG